MPARRASRTLQTLLRNSAWGCGCVRFLGDGGRAEHSSGLSGCGAGCSREAPDVRVLLRPSPCNATSPMHAITAAQSALAGLHVPSAADAVHGRASVSLHFRCVPAGGLPSGSSTQHAPNPTTDVSAFLVCVQPVRDGVSGPDVCLGLVSQSEWTCLRADV